MKKFKNCTAETTGIITGIKSKGLDFPTMITVRYATPFGEFEIRDSIKYKTEKIKVGFLTVGTRNIAVMGNTAVGTEVRVLFNPESPEEACLPDNVGRYNA